jgi:LuxR family quorum sensing-dependent transcriptional regulator
MPAMRRRQSIVPCENSWIARQGFVHQRQSAAKSFASSIAMVKTHAWGGVREMPTAAQIFGQDVLDFIENIDHLSSAKQLAREMDTVIAGFGFDAFLIGGHKARPDLSFNDILLATKCPTEFVTTYSARNYLYEDPTFKRCISSSRPFDFNSLDYDERDGPRVPDMMHLVEDFGFSEGFLVPIHGPAGYEAAVGMLGDKLDLSDGIRAGLHLICIYAYEWLSELAGNGVNRTPLTPREREVLAWAAQGKSAWEIGEILMIAKRTVDEHAQTAMRKLGAVNRTQAVAIAIRHRLFEP